MQQHFYGGFFPIFIQENCLSTLEQDIDFMFRFCNDLTQNPALPLKSTLLQLLLHCFSPLVLDFCANKSVEILQPIERQVEWCSQLKSESIILHLHKSVGVSTRRNASAGGLEISAQAGYI